MTRLDPAPLAAYGGLPESYRVVDVETTGIDHDSDRVIQLGWCDVAGRRAVKNASAVVNWPAAMAAVEVAALAARLDKTRATMESRGNSYPWTVDLLRKVGLPPAEVWKKFTAGHRPTDYVAHYGWLLDYGMIGRFAEATGASFAPDHAQLHDTGLLTKACLMSLRRRPDEGPRSYYLRVYQAGGSPRHNLERCLDLFGLHGSGAVKRHMHGSADYDAWVTHLIFEKLRNMLVEVRYVGEVR